MVIFLLDVRCILFQYFVLLLIYLNSKFIHNNSKVGASLFASNIGSGHFIGNWLSYLIKVINLLTGFMINSYKLGLAGSGIFFLFFVHIA